MIPTANDTEQRILEAAEQEFMLKGFAGARTTSIAETAGVTHAMLHYYFRTKERLFDRIISDKVNLLRHALTTSIGDASRPLEEIIKEIIERHIDFVTHNPGLPLFLMNELLARSDRANIFIDKISEYLPKVMADLQQKIDAEADAGRCRRVDARMLLLDIASLNVFPLLALPAFTAVTHGKLGERDAFLELRKKENLETILRKLKP